MKNSDIARLTNAYLTTEHGHFWNEAYQLHYVVATYMLIAPSRFALFFGAESRVQMYGSNRSLCRLGCLGTRGSASKRHSLRNKLIALQRLSSDATFEEMVYFQARLTNFIV
jgi:hypothetical protein